MRLSRSAHVDTFCRDRLPPQDQWPELLLSVDGVDGDRLNCATALLDDTVARFGADRGCLLVPDGEDWSYGRLLATANRIAHVLADDLGVVPGARVLLRGPNNPWLVAAWFGVLKAGGVVVATMPLLREQEVAEICKVAQISVVLCDYRFVEAIVGLEGVCCVRYGGCGQDDLSQLVMNKPVGFDDVVTAVDDVALLAFTSGTTGRPKAAMHFHRDVLAIADTFSANIVRPRADDIFTGTPPLAFTFGLGGLLVFPLRVGASTLLLEKATPTELAHCIADRAASQDTNRTITTSAVPPNTRYRRPAANQQRSPKDISGKRCVRFQLRRGARSYIMRAPDGSQQKLGDRRV